MMQRCIVQRALGAGRPKSCHSSPKISRLSLLSHPDPPRLPLTSFRRYATDKSQETQTASQSNETANSDGAKTVDPEVKKDSELESKEREIIDLKDKYLRSVAEFRNLQNQTKREVQSAKNFAIQKFAKDLVDSVDNLDRALSIVPADKLTPNADEGPAQKELITLFDGLKMTETILMQSLKKHGLERFDPSVEGEVFNPNLHEATFMTPMEGKEDGTVFTTQQKGFTLNGRVLRAAKVGVVKNA
ncbi:MAG: Mitochondrial matrix cochaperone [Vezdaea aestivalis]|nr:MAG: Mitochondrial matrix cochaperone [Vezdaea aestivalis]